MAWLEMTTSSIWSLSWWLLINGHWSFVERSWRKLQSNSILWYWNTVTPRNFGSHRFWYLHDGIYSLRICMEPAEKNNGSPRMDICVWRVTRWQEDSGAGRGLQGQSVERTPPYLDAYKNGKTVWPCNCMDSVTSLVVQFVLIVGSLSG